MPRRCTSKSCASTISAFTLVELLVVVAVLAVLIALLLPALAKARQQALAVKCTANLRTLGQALTMYTQRYGRYPSCQMLDLDNGRYWAIWPVRLRRFVGGDQGPFHCPARDERFEWRKGQPPAGLPLVPATPDHARLGYDVGEPLLDRARAPFSYGYNAEGTSWGGFRPPDERHRGLGDDLILQRSRVGGHELRASRVRSPSEMVAITDGAADGVSDFYALPYHTDPRLWPGDVHNGGANVLFCDGHVQWHPQKALLVNPLGPTPEDIPVRRMWNNDHRP